MCAVRCSDFNLHANTRLPSLPPPPFACPISMLMMQQSDWGATHSASINSGLDQEMPAGQYMNNGRNDWGHQDCQAPADPNLPPHLCPQINDGNVTLATLRNSAMRVLTPMFAVGIFDNPNANTTTNNVSTAQTVGVARRVAAAAMVLLKNDGDVLPLSLDIGSIAVVGVEAGHQVVAGGGGSGSVATPLLVAPLDAIRHTLGIQSNSSLACTGPPLPPPNPADCAAPKFNNTDFPGNDIVEPPLKVNTAGECCAACTSHPDCVVYTYDGGHPGNCYLKSKMNNPQHGPGRISGTPSTLPPPVAGEKCVTYTDGSDLTKAAAAAAQADVTLVFVYTNSGEGTDRSSMDINDAWNGSPGTNTTSIIEAVANVTKKVVVIIVSPGAVLTPWRSEVSGIIAGFMPGQQYGNAIADVLFGIRPPTGRLPLTFPAQENDLQLVTKQWPGLPAPNPVTGIVGDHGLSYYAEKLEVGYRFYDAKQVTPAFPFGHGLTYTSFKYSNLVFTKSSVSFTLTNTGSRDGTEVVQLYMGFPATAGEPPKQLKGFQQVPVNKNGSVQVKLALNDRSFSIWDVSTHAWTIPSGTFTAMVGRSSRDIQLTGTIRT